MAPTIRQYVNDGSGANANATAATGSGTQAGDLVVACLVSDYGSEAQLPASPSGTPAGTWNHEFTANVNGTNRCWAKWWWRITTVGGVHNVNGKSANTEAGNAMHVWVVTAGTFDTTDPVSTFAWNGSGTGTSTQHTIASVNGPDANCLWLGVGVSDGNVSGNVNYTGAPSGSTWETPELDPTIYFTTRGARITTGIPATPGGAIGAKTFTASAARQWVASSILIRPPAAAPPPAITGRYFHMLGT